MMRSFTTLHIFEQDKIQQNLIVNNYNNKLLKAALLIENNSRHVLHIIIRE